MGWSEQIGSALTIPGDKNPDDVTDTRDWISIGEEVPAELTSYLSAGIFFRAGNYVENAPYMQVKYFGMGAYGTRFFQFVYVENVTNIPGNHQLINLASWEFDDDYTLRSDFGPYTTAGGNFAPAINPVNGGKLVNRNHITSTRLSVLGYQNTWTDFEPVGFSPGKYWINAVGDLRFVGLLKMISGIAANQGVTICTLPVDCRPAKQIVAQCTVNGTTLARVDFAPNGNVIWQGNAFAVAGTAFVSFNLTLPLGESSDI